MTRATDDEIRALREHAEREAARCERRIAKAEALFERATGIGDPYRRDLARARTTIDALDELAELRAERDAFAKALDRAERDVAESKRWENNPLERATTRAVFDALQRLDRARDAGKDGG